MRWEVSRCCISICRGKGCRPPLPDGEDKVVCSITIVEPAPLGRSDHRKSHLSSTELPQWVHSANSEQNPLVPSDVANHPIAAKRLSEISPS